MTDPSSPSPPPGPLQVDPSPLLSRERFRRLFQRGPGPRARLDLFPLRHHLRHYRGSDFKADAKAGCNVALLDFPQGLAYAMIAGLPFQMGIYGSAIAAVLGAFLASSRFLMLGPTNAIAVLFLSSVLALNFDQSQAILALPLLLIMVGGFLILGAFLRLASIIHYVSRTVITGYITAAALLIVVNQARHVLGVELPHASTFFEVLTQTVQAVSETQWATFAVGVATAVTFLLLKHFRPGWPNVAITLVAATCAASFLRRHGFELPPISAAGLDSQSWAPTLPAFSFSLLSQLSGPALALAFLSLLESASIAKTLGARAGDRVDVNQQMLSMGVANLGCAFGGGMPISGSLTRSVLNWSSGARTPVASLISGSLLAVGILVLGPFLGAIPKSALAALVIMVGLSLLNGRNIRMVLGSTGGDAVVFILTLASGILFPLDRAILLGAAASIAVFLRKAATPQLVEYGFTESGQEISSSLPDRPALALLHVEGDLFFGSSDIFLDQTRRMVEDQKIQAVILRLRNAHHLDATCAMAIEEVVRFARDRGRLFIVCGAHPEVYRVFRDSGLLRILGPENFFLEDPDNPTLSTSRALRQVRRVLGTQADVRLFVDPAKRRSSPDLTSS